MDGVTLKEALNEYKNVYMAYRNFADRTRVEYQNDIKDFIAFSEGVGIKHVGELGLPVIERYVAHLEQNGFASLTRKRKVVTVRSFLTFLYQDRYIEGNIAKKIILPFVENTTPYVLTQTERNRIRNACADNARDKAIIELLFQTGIRLSELIKLTLNDIDLEDAEIGYVRITGNRGKNARTIPLPYSSCAAIRNYLDARKDAETENLFLNRFGAPLGERGVQKILRKWLIKAKIGRASVHTLRHTFGAHHMAQGTNLSSLQKAMGHSDIRSTSRYVSLANTLAARELLEHSL